MPESRVLTDDEIEDAYRDAWAALVSAGKAWREKWPNHCAQCFGWGGFSYEERHGFKGGGSETIFDLCEALPERTCHRCGALGLTDEMEGPCRVCGWNFDDGDPSSQGL